MTIGIDIRVLGNPVKSGIEEYTENLLSRLITLDSRVKYKLFFSSLKGRCPDYDWLHLKNVELHQYKLPNKFLFASSALFNLPKVDLMMGGVDVFFSPHFFLTSLSPKCKRVTTFHDLSYVHFPEFFSWRKNIWHNFEMNPLWQSRFSDKIIAVSNSTKQDLINTYRVDPTKIELIYSGISPDMNRPPEDMLKEFKIKNNLPDRFIYFLGKFEPRKNIPGIVRAFNILKNNEDMQDVKLVLAGSNGWLYKNIFKEIELSKFNKDIILKNYINNEDRKYYYSLASVFIYPSYFEGFGFPPLESMACGTPVIISNNSSLPEIAGDNSLLVNSENIHDMAKSVTSILDDNRLKTTLCDLGYKKSKNFSWDRTAENTLSCLTSNVDKT